MDRMSKPVSLNLKHDLNLGMLAVLIVIKVSSKLKPPFETTDKVS